MARSDFDKWSAQFNKKASEWQKMTREETFNAGMRWANQPRNKSSEPWLKDDIERFLAMVEQGSSAAQIAEELGRTKTAVYAKCRYFGVKLTYPKGKERKTVKVSEWQVAHIKRLRSRGWTRREVANLFGVNIDYITHITTGYRRSA